MSNHLFFLSILYLSWSGLGCLQYKTIQILQGLEVEAVIPCALPFPKTFPKKLQDNATCQMEYLHDPPRKTIAHPPKKPISHHAGSPKPSTIALASTNIAKIKMSIVKPYKQPITFFF
jgi:hypothetical protein